MKNTSVSLGDHCANSWSEKSPRAGLRRRAKCCAPDCGCSTRAYPISEALRAALIEGENSGPSQPFDIEEFLAARHKEVSGQ